MIRLRTRLIAVFLVATIIPLVVTAAVMSSLIEQSLTYSTTEDLDRLALALEQTGRDYYLQAREALKEDALKKAPRDGAVEPTRFSTSLRSTWPATVEEFWQSGEAERFSVTENGDDERIEYPIRSQVRLKPDTTDATSGEVLVYARPLGAVRLNALQAQIRDTRALVARARERDLRRGLTTVLFMLIAAVWIVSFGILVYVANRMSRPIQQLTTGLSQLAAGHLDTRIESDRRDEIGTAIAAFNDTASQLQQDRDRLVYLTQMASWQLLARKMAHELKNSLTPIRLTVEEIRARRPEGESGFIDQAVQIVVSEVESLERRVRAFSELASEPTVRLAPVDVNALVQERVAFLKTSHANVTYTLDLDAHAPLADADPDRVKGILTNVLENAADAAAAGAVLARTSTRDGVVQIEIHDSGPGLSHEARATLFEPTISFKARGMGLGLSIARKDALVCGGDLMLIDSTLGGAAFRLVLRTASDQMTNDQTTRFTRRRLTR